MQQMFGKVGPGDGGYKVHGTMPFEAKVTLFKSTTGRRKSVALRQRAPIPHRASRKR